VIVVVVMTVLAAAAFATVVARIALVLQPSYFANMMNRNADDVLLFLFLAPRLDVLVFDPQVHQRAADAANFPLNRFDGIAALMLDLYLAADMAMKLEAEVTAQMRQPHAQPIDAQIERRAMDRKMTVAAAAAVAVVAAAVAVVAVAMEMEMTVTPMMMAVAAVVTMMPMMPVMPMTTAFGHTDPPFPGDVLPYVGRNAEDKDTCSVTPQMYFRTTAPAEKDRAGASVQSAGKNPHMINQR